MNYFKFFMMVINAIILDEKMHLLDFSKGCDKNVALLIILI